MDKKAVGANSCHNENWFFIKGWKIFTSLADGSQVKKVQNLLHAHNYM